MFGNSGKLGRGGAAGGRGVKRLIPPHPPHRPAGGASRLSIGAAPPSRNRPGGAATAAAPAVPEETFSLVSADPLAFGLIIRLAPDLVEEIRRLEGEGGVARIKFDANPNNDSGNVIDVGGKDFRFTWSREFGDCDIYEERQSGEEGTGLLVESGSAWRKLNVQRVLDESTKNHVKKRSEEAERQLKSRQAIVLDPANPSMKNKVKSLAAAAVDMNPRRIPFKPKKEAPFKKRKVETSQVPIAGPLKSVFKPVISASTAKARPSISPQPSPPEQLPSSTSPLRAGNPVRVHPSTDEVIVAASQLTSKEDVSYPEKELPTKAAGSSGCGISGHKNFVGATQMDLHNTLISLLLDNPKGMSLKALEKAVGDTIPNSGRKIETIIKKIANFQAPGRYILKPGVEMESLKKSSSESGSSPESVRNRTPVAETSFSGKSPTQELEPKTHLSARLQDESNANLGMVDTHHESPNTSDRRVGDNGEEKAVSSSESGSDSESDTESSDSGSDSGSQSRSRSKSRSPAGSGSGTSSDSESDGSSSSKEGSDEDVDIIMASDDEKGERAPEFRVGQGTTDDIDRHNELDESREDAQKGKEMDDADDTDVDIDITRDSPIADIAQSGNQENEIERSADMVHKESFLSSLERGEIPLSPDTYKQTENQKGPFVGIFANDIDGPICKRELNPKVTSVHGQAESFERDPTIKPKRPSDSNLIQDKPEKVKRLKMGRADLQPDKEQLDGDAYFNSQIGHQTLSHGSLSDDKMQGSRLGPGFLNFEVPDLEQSNQRVSDNNMKKKNDNLLERRGKYADNLGRGGRNFDPSSFHDELGETAVKSTGKEKPFKESLQESNDAWDKPAKNIKESANGEKLSDLYNRKSGEPIVKGKNSGEVERSGMLRRELSDLELGEFREPMPSEETQGPKKEFERKNSFKSSENEIQESIPSEDLQGAKRMSERKIPFRTPENKSSGSDNLSSDLGKGRTVAKGVQESKRSSSPNRKVGVNQEGLFRKRASDDDLEDSMRHVVVDHADSDGGSQLDKTAESTHRTKKNEGRVGQKFALETNLAQNKKGLGRTVDPVPGRLTVGSSSSKDTKPQKVKPSVDSIEKRKDKFSVESCNNGGRKKDSSSDEDTSLYSKYDKDEPEAKGPIKDYVQYKEYVQEYQEMFALYRTLSRSLEKYRIEFEKLGRDLEHARDRDPEAYHAILEQVKESYRHCGMRHKRLKKIFIVVHEELRQIKQRIIDYAQTRPKD